MPPNAAQQRIQLALARKRQAALRAAEAQKKKQPKGVAPQPERGQALRMFTRQVILRPLATDILFFGGWASFGLSWVGLFLYTFIKDLAFGIFGSPLADPGDIVFLATPPKTIESLPKRMQHAPRIPTRFPIYIMGPAVLLIYATILIIILAPPALLISAITG
jgi:hypothetical protein